MTGGFTTVPRRRASGRAARLSQIGLAHIRTSQTRLEQTGRRAANA